ncbi:MAG: exonuclease SbcCD subunit D C-terminal domain-containing protein [Bacteroidetes bacterium]|nr:exonuclease SbcCD subunit D C-terminal domain-containing protein [Bacteroidota bacterium]
MRILHTSDWHLGQKFIGQSRDLEHGMALDWLLEQINRLEIDVLVVAGDIFDVNNPPLSAETLYFQFLARLRDTPCRHIVLIGGNHDAPGKIDAPKYLMQALGIHVVGKAGENPAACCIPLYDQNGKPELIVAAVPFLRDRDFKTGASGEGMEARMQRIRDGIYLFYQEIAAAALDLQAQFDPKPALMTTGHLYAKGAQATAEQQNIYIGDLENISADAFPDCFEYVALGHIHRPQMVGKKNHIRYSGSLIPLSFSEIQDQKTVIFLEMEAEKGLTQLESVPVPVFRKLASVRGALPEVENQLAALDSFDAPLSTWVEVEVQGEQVVADLSRHLRDFCKNFKLEILKIRRQGNTDNWENSHESAALEALSVEEVFLKRCEGMGLDSTVTKNLVQSFQELRNWMETNEI